MLLNEKFSDDLLNLNSIYYASLFSIRKENT